MTVEAIHAARIAGAQTEVGQTTISRGVALTLTVVFVAVSAAVPITQAWVGPEVLRLAPDAAVTSPEVNGPSLLARVMRGNRQALAAIQRFADGLDNASLLARQLRPAVQRLLTRSLGAGNERIYIGRDDWLYYAADVRHVTGRGFLDEGQLARRAASGNSLADAPAPDPRPALLAFNEALARRGITLVLLPTPVKPSIHPEHIGLETSAAPVRNASFAQFAEELRGAGVLLFDPAPLLAGLVGTGDPAYLARDTHWRPEAVQAVARELARFLQRETSLPDREPVSYRTRAARVSNQGDSAMLLDLPANQRRYPNEEVELLQPLTPDGRPWRPEPSADVLLLGDSFTNIYSLAAMGWGAGAGLAEQLSVALDRPLDRLVQNDNGAFATREALARELARGRDRLAGKRVVVYQFATRELTLGDWRLVNLDMRRATVAPTVLTPEPGQVMTVEGRVRQVTPAPRPGTVPYRDHIIAVDLADIDTGGAMAVGSEALVYLSSMEDNVQTAAASLVVGQTIALTLRPWAEVAPDLDGITRAELAAGNVVFAEPWWGELIEP